MIESQQRSDQDRPPPAEFLRRDAQCDGFEDAWKAGQRPQIETYLDQEPAARREELFRELLRVEVAYRRAAGERPETGEYRTRFPEYGDHIQAAFEEPAGPEELSTAEGRLGPSTISPESAPSLLEPGYPFQIGKYRVIEFLGRGGQAEVFRAVHPQLAGRDVVVKWARHCLSAAQRQQMLAEGAALARLDDPGLVRVYDVDEHEGRPFVVMEYVPGRSLQERLRQGRPSFRESAALVAELARTLERVHQRGICHRDLKPANVLIDQAGRPRLLDFGLAWLEEPFAPSSRPEGSISGTFAYMAPEQAHGLAARIGPRSDVFGLGAVLYHLLTGRPPYQGSDPMEVWDRARQGQVTPPRQLNRRISASLEGICLKAMARDAEQRYSSAGALAQALGRWRRRRPLALGAVALGLAILGFLWALLPGRQIAPSTGPPAGPLAIQSFRVEHFTPQAGLTKPHGDIGKDSFSAHFMDQVRIRAELSESAYCYLLSLNPKGEVQPFWPANEGTTPQACSSLRFPENLGQECLNLDDEERGGLQAFVLLAARQPLPDYEAWRRSQPAWAWKRVPAQGKVVWRGDGQSLDPVAAGDGDVRATFGHLADPELLTATGRQLRAAPGVEALAVVAFPVLPK